MTIKHSFKDVMLEIAASRKTNIYGLADMLGITNQSLYMTIAKKSLSLKKLEEWIKIFNLTDDEILSLVKARSETDIINESIDNAEKE